MSWTSALAIYFLFWSITIFLVLPFGMRTADEAGAAKVPGQADSAPYGFDPVRTAIRVTAVATVLFVLFYANYMLGWITPEMLDWVH